MVAFPAVAAAVAAEGDGKRNNFAAAAKDAVVCPVAGQAWFTFIAQLGLDPIDPFPECHTLSDTWLLAI